VYWLGSNDNRLSLRPEPVPAAGSGRVSPEQQLRTALETLLKGRANNVLGSAIPEGTQLLGLEVRPGGIYVNLSQKFAEGGGSTALIERVAQVIYTVTSTAPDSSVYLSIEGKPIDDKNPLGGEGLVLKQPTNRSEFNADFQ
jgi:spore germination protein GerM